MNDLLLVIVGGGIGFLQGLILYILSSQSKKLDSICRDNREDHKQIFEKLDGHGHRITVIEGKV